MIVNLEVVKDFSENIFENLTTVLVYQGPRPTVGVYIAGFLTDFNWSGNYLLQAYNDIDLSVVKSNNSYRLYKVNGEYGSFSRQAGIAAWAVLFDKNLTNDLIEFNSQEKTVTFKRDIRSDDAFMIVPVTDSMTNGVLRFTSLSFTHPADENIQRFEIDFSNL